MAQRMTNRFIPLRSIILTLFCVAVALILGGRLFYLQIISYDKYEAKVLDNISSTTTVDAARGIIYDRNMNQLASNYTVYRIFISPRDIETDEQKYLICDGLSRILGVEYSTVLEEAEKTRYADRTIKKNVEEDIAKEVQTFIAENNLSEQIYVEASSKRYYPYSNLAAQTIGFCNADGGVIGIEYQYDQYLTGSSGRYVTARDAWGKSMASKYETYVEPKNGANVITTIDIKIQSVLENQVKKTYFESESMNRAVGIVMDVNTGGILGMATYPDFDLNDPYSFNDEYMKILDSYVYHENDREYNNYIEKIYEFLLARDNYEVGTDEYQSAYMNLLYSTWKNKAVSELYEPGSTFKIITTSMAFEENLISPYTEFTCYYPYEVDGTKIKCHRYGGHGTNVFSYMLQQSCNPTLIQVAQLVGRETFYKYYEAYGYTSKTGIDLPAESAPIYHAYSGFNSVELACYSFGQTFKVTPIQQITAISTVANGGHLVTPHIVSSVVDDDGNVLYSADETSKRQIVSEETCKTITQILTEGVAGDGGAKNTHVAGYDIAAKTGTSEVRDILDENGNSFLRVGSTVAFAPSDDPQIAVLIVCDQPICENIYGAYVAAPYVASTLEELLPYIGVERNLSEEEIASMNVTLRNYVGLSVVDVTQDLSNRGINCKVYGSGDTVTYQAPIGGSLFNRDNGTVFIYSGDYTPNKYSTVPSLVGKTAAAANQTIINAGLNPVIEGVSSSSGSSSTAVVISQSPEAGESVLYGSTVTVTMRYIDGSD